MPGRLLAVSSEVGGGERFVYWKCLYIQLTHIVLLSVSSGLVDNKSILVQVLGDNPLPKPLMIKFTDAYKRHWALKQQVIYMSFPPIYPG